MAKNPLERAIKSAVSMNDTLGNMFADAGNVTKGSGYVVRAYKNANRALPQALKEDNRRSAVRDVMFELRQSLSINMRESLWGGVNAGLYESARQLKFYGIDSDPSKTSVNLNGQVNLALDALLAQVDSQDAILQAMLQNESIDEAMILGDESRQGIIRAGDILAGAAYWIAALTWDSFSWWSKTNQKGFDFQKQAVAALDGRTTDCCLRAHGQIVPLNGKFELTGTPRFADQLDWTPFHWRCRTSVVLYLPEYDGGLTDRMRGGADYLLEQRKQGKNPDQHPADAYWN
jgi:hypothetical protein